MAEYKYAKYLTQITDGTLDKTFPPSTATPLSGIYRCDVCGHEAVSTKDHPLPPQNHHQHANRLVPIAWRLIVVSTHA